MAQESEESDLREENKRKSLEEPSEEEIDIFGGKQNDAGTFIP